MKRCILLILSCLIFVPLQSMDELRDLFRLAQPRVAQPNEDTSLLKQLLRLPSESQKLFLHALDQPQNAVLASEEFKAQQKKYEKEAEEQRARQEAMRTEQEIARKEKVESEIKLEQQKKMNIELNALLQRERDNAQHVRNVELKAIDLGNAQTVEQQRQKAQVAENNRFIAEKDKQNDKFLRKQKEQEEALIQDKDYREKNRLAAAKEQHDKQLASEKKLHDQTLQQKKEEHDRQTQNQERLLKEKMQKKEELLLKEEEVKERIRQAELDQTKKIEDMKQQTAVIKAKAQAEKEKELITFAREDEARHPDYYVQKRKNELQAKKDEFSNKVAAIKDAFTNLSNEGQLRKLFMYTGTTVAGAAGGIFFFKNTWPVLRQLVENYLFTPFLIDETSVGWNFSGNKHDHEKLTDLYFEPGLQTTINGIAQTLKKTHQKGGYYLNYLFFGPPGTGKTATARALAFESGMDYALMSGGNVQKLLKSGKAEQRLKEVFEWAHTSKKGLLLFIDEADAFLKDPKSAQMTEELYAVINSFLNLTGKENKKLALVLSSNHPNALAPAVLDRIGPGQYFHFGLPKLEQRIEMTRCFVKRYLSTILAASLNEPGAMNVDEIAEYIASKTEGFSGRNLSYMVLALEKALLLEDTPVITKPLVDKVVNNAIEQKQLASKFHSYA